MEVRRNARFGIGESVELLFNPITKLTSGIIPATLNEQLHESFIGYNGYSGDDSEIGVSDVFATRYFGGRVTSVLTNEIAVGVSYDTFADEVETYMKGYNSIDAYIFKRKVDDYFYCLGGSGYIQETGGSDGYRITGCRILEQSIETDNKRFGYGQYLFESGWKDMVKILIPASTPEWKLQQIINSTAVAIKGNSTIYTNVPIYSEYDQEYDEEYGNEDSGSGDWTTIDNYNYYVQYGGGSCSPVIRLIDLDSSSFKFNSRRNQFELEGVMLG